MLFKFEILDIFSDFCDCSLVRGIFERYIFDVKVFRNGLLLLGFVVINCWSCPYYYALPLYGP